MNTKKTKNLVLCGMFVALIAIGARISIPIPVVPITLQTMFTVLAGLLLGGRWGFVSVCIYIALGLLGLPMFVSGGGLGYVFSPTFGYLIGFALGTYVTGTIAYKVKNISFLNILLASLAGIAIVYICGMIYFYIIRNFYMDNPIGLWSLFVYCFLLTIPGDIITCILCAILGKRLIPLIKAGKI